ncbi:hypothetical protein [Sphingobacterium multivorum]|uniref:hypothetical protein n=1 Tax=Sphingobacterium multivorum TaxID=28454 RepID=UPI0028A6BBBC|nr:hypothetical protein [Sphingobacterium multivorum]
MILFLQFTVTDTRYFSPYRADILTKPEWPSPRPFREFVRNSGKIIERGKGGQSSWVGENFICEINRGIIIERCTLPSGATLSNLAKHLYAGEHYLLAKYEFVFNLKISNTKLKIDQNLLKQLINEVLAVEIKIKLDGKVMKVPINQLQNPLKRFHYKNITIKEKADQYIGLTHLRMCTPQLYFYLDNNEFPAKIGNNYKRIADIHNIAKLYGSWHNHKSNPFRVWIHHRLSNSQRIIQNRELRMTIMRLHSEYECLKNLINGLSNGLITTAERTLESDQLQKYFNLAIRTFLQEEKNIEFKTRSNGFFDYFSKVFAHAAPGELERLKRNIEHFRINIKNKIINYYKEAKFVSNKFENHNSTILVQGTGNVVKDNQVIQQVGQAIEKIDFEKLIGELAQILPVAQSEAKTTEDFQSVLALSQAKDAAEKKDKNGVLKALEGVGKFVEDVATKFTAAVLVELLKSHTPLFK